MCFSTFQRFLQASAKELTTEDIMSQMQVEIMLACRLDWLGLFGLLDHASGPSLARQPALFTGRSS